MDGITMMADKALVRLEERDWTSKQGLHLYRDMREGYQAGDDWEIGVVENLGPGDWEPLEVGDKVIVKAPTGGKAGADVSRDLGEHRGNLVVVSWDEIVGKVE